MTGKDFIQTDYIKSENLTITGYDSGQLYGNGDIKIAISGKEAELRGEQLFKLLQHAFNAMEYPIRTVESYEPGNITVGGLRENYEIEISRSQSKAADTHLTGIHNISIDVYQYIKTARPLNDKPWTPPRTDGTFGKTIPN